jgi:hypothetical protein
MSTTPSVGQSTSRSAHQPTGQVRARRGRRQIDRGAATVEVAGWVTLMLLAMLVGVQVVMWGYAALGARYTADHAAQTSRVQGGTAAAGTADAHAVLATVVGNGLQHPQVTVTRSATTVTVTVTGNAVAVLPGLSVPVTAAITTDVERIN